MGMFWSSKNDISSKYTLFTSPTFVAEPWSVYTARLKSSSTGTNGNVPSPTKVSVFLFDKKRFENYLANYGIIKSKSSSSTHDRQILQEAYDVLRNEVANMAKLKHPNVLTLIEPLEEHSKNFMFATEYVSDSLESVFSNTNDEEQNFFKSHVREDVVIHRGIFQIVNALDFIHNRASSVHLNIQPRSIFINENSDWKVSGLGHLVKLVKDTNTTEYLLSQYDPRMPKFAHLDLDFTAPEIVLDGVLSPKSDFFALGLLIYLLYSGEQILHSKNSTTEYKDEYSKFQKKINTMGWEQVFNKLPLKLRHHMVKLMNRDIYSRYDNITDFLASDFFQDPIIKTLNFLDDLPTKDNEEKLVFLEGLLGLLPQFPATLLQRKFLTVFCQLLDQLCNDKIVNARCLQLDLEVIISISQEMSQLSFQEKVLPSILKDTNLPVILVNASNVLIDHLSVMKEKMKQQDFVTALLKPLITYVLDDMEGDAAVGHQESLLGEIQLILGSMDFLTVKKFLLPYLAKLFTKTTSLKIKVICISCFEMMVKIKAIDAYVVCDEILPLFRSMKSREPRILLKALSFFEVIPHIVNDETILVEQLLTLLWSYSMSSTLTTTEYSAYTKVINRVSQDIQHKHLEQLGKSGKSPIAEGEQFQRIIKSSSSSSQTKEPQVSINVPAIQPKKKNPAINHSYLSSPLNNSTNDFDDFVSASNHYGTISTKSKTTLPPGFSVPLEPNKKPYQKL